MINTENNNTYKEALYSVKRGFLIIGLTGYTGSGCSTARKILENKNQDNHIPIPHYIGLEVLTSLSHGEYAKLKRFGTKFLGILLYLSKFLI